MSGVSNYQLKNINEYIQSFLSEHGSEELIDAWNSKDTQKKFLKILQDDSSTKKTTIKDPNKPKRNKTAYIFFCSDRRQEVKEELGDSAKTTDIMSRLGELWNEMNEDAKTDEEVAEVIEQYKKAASDDKERYDLEMASYESPSEEEIIANKKASKVKDPNRPKRNKTAYIFFCSANRTNVKNELGDDAKTTDVSVELGKRWNALKDSTKSSDKKEFAKYEKEALEDRKRYDIAISDYNDPNKTNDIEEVRESDIEEVPKKGKSKGKTKTKQELPEEISESDVEEVLKKGKIKGKAKTKQELPEEVPEEVRESDIEEVPKKGKSKGKQEVVESDSKKTTGYQVFCKENRAEVKSENPEVNAGTITSMLAAMWKQLDKEEQEEWNLRAKK